MAFTLTAFTYILALILDAFLIFFSVFHVSWNHKYTCNAHTLITTLISTINHHFSFLLSLCFLTGHCV